MVLPYNTAPFDPSGTSVRRVRFATGDNGNYVFLENPEQPDHLRNAGSRFVWRQRLPRVKQGPLNSASYHTDGVPGGLMSIFGQGLCARTIYPNGLLDLKTGMYPTVSSDSSCQVMVGNVAVPLLYVSDSQIDFQLPFDLSATAPLDVQTCRLDFDSCYDVGSLQLTAIAPEIFEISTSTGPGAAPIVFAAARKNSDASLITSANRAPAGSYIQV